MAAYYNDVDKEACAVLRRLIADGVIAPGDVDDRSIADVQPDDLRGYTQHHFFAGGGLWSVALRDAGWADERRIVTGSCPCQPFSAAGKGLRTADARHLWPHFFRLLSALRPSVIMGEQVAGAAGYAWFDGVAADLDSIGYASRAVDLTAQAVNAPQQRQRLYWLSMADPDRCRHDGGTQAPKWGQGYRTSFERLGGGFWGGAEWRSCADGQHRRHKPFLRLLAHGDAWSLGARRIAGNAIVPPLATEVIAALMDTLPPWTPPARVRTRNAPR